MLKLYRQQHLFRRYRMVQVPLLDEEVDERYQAQVICSPDVMENDTLVLLIHQFGNLRVELAGALTCDVRQECSYLVRVLRLFSLSARRLGLRNVPYTDTIRLANGSQWEKKGGGGGGGIDGGTKVPILFSQFSLYLL
ncbi:hypothetical protein DFH11DRAFT_1542637 [Phellopilus nigrolimitatus]|nr:hypothetical protein DFH11DRAFT_1542637 [Phellopilus nigrolimitatus]